ncbi:MAG TPA: hypothetical protein DHW71_01645 [Gammaproteobacteria bacterium]|nr:hypothetical protein [Gammaproteobacteria bacterium]
MTKLISQGHQKKVSLLVIDDDPTIRLAAEDLLSAEGFDVKCIESPQELPDLLTDYHPDAFLVDVNLPFMNGYQVCEYIRNEHGMHCVPILMMTANDEVESVNKAYDAGATDFISKPINYLLLAHRVKYMLRNHDSLRQFMQQQSSLVQAQHIAKLGYWSLNIEDNSIDIEPYSAELLGWKPDIKDEQPMSYSDLLAHVDPHDLPMVAKAFGDLLQSRQPFTIRHRVRTSTGEERVLFHQGDIFVSECGRYVRAIGTIQDITERKKAEQKIYEMAFYDQLTLLPNRAFMKEYWDRLPVNMIDADNPFAVICLSLNQFSRVNDSFGQDIGDELMRRVANRLNRAGQSIKMLDKLQVFANDTLVNHTSRKKSDIVARVDNNSFIFFSKQFGTEDALQQLCKDIQTLIAPPFTIHGTSIFLSCTLGVACLSDEINTFSGMIDAALSAVSYAKQQENESCVYFTSEMMIKARARIELEKDLRSSLKNEDFFLVYQPKVCLDSLKIKGFEALVRWQHPTKGLIPPNEFISIAEETGLIEELGLFVLRQACIDLGRLEDAGYHDVSMALNISPRQFSQVSFTDIVSETIHEIGIKPEKLELEITESIIMKNVDHALQMLHTMKDIGVSIALDDFGTGYSSFSYLTKFPFDVLKIDQAFLRSIPDDKNALAIVISIANLSKGLGMRNVVEGIEAPEQLFSIMDIDCDYGQGYLFSAPKVFDEVLHMLAHKDWSHFIGEKQELQLRKLP